jgi:hypothetical protein
MGVDVVEGEVPPDVPDVTVAGQQLPDGGFCLAQ